MCLVCAGYTAQNLAAIFARPIRPGSRLAWRLGARDPLRRGGI